MEPNPCLIGILTRDLCGEDEAHVSLYGIEVLAENVIGRIGGLRGSRGSRVMVTRSVGESAPRTIRPSQVIGLRVAAIQKISY